MARNLIGKIECYYVNHGYGSYINFKNSPDYVKVYIDDVCLMKKFYKEIPFNVYDEGYYYEILNHKGFLSWLRKWMKVNHVYFNRIDYNKYTSTSTTLRNEEYEFK